MRIFRLAITGALVAILLLTTVAPAFAAPETAKDKVQVQFQNKTGASARITLTGPATVYLTLSNGKTKSELVPGTYKYSYDACGKTNTGTFKVRKAGDTLTLPKCKTGGGGGGGEGKIKIKNSTGGTITIIMSGPQSYTFYVSAGTSQLSVIKGKYNYTAYGCGGASTSGSIKPGGVITFWCY
jgi:hypothetical protein